MKTTLLIIILCSYFTNGKSQIMWQINKDTVKTWYYQDGDEFNDTTVNTKRWYYTFGWGRSIASQKEQQYYTSGKNHKESDGSLKLFPKKQKIEARLVDWMADNDSVFHDKDFLGLNKRLFNYTSGMLQSEKKYKYGYFEIKFKIPKEKGLWPAFWIYGSTPNEEIDWMELKTEKPNAIHVGRHSQKREENKMRNIIRKKWWGQFVYFKGNLNQGFNVISGEWTPEYLKYYLNGECIAYSKVSFNNEKSICLNLAVPSNNGAFKPGPDENLTEFGNFEIDYIRTWTSNKNPNYPTVEKLYSKNSYPNRPISKSQLKSKTKFIYGKKSEHKNEGVTLSLFPETKNVYNAIVLGKGIPDSLNYNIINSENQVLKSGNLKYGDNAIDFNSINGDNFELQIICDDKKISYPINKL